MVSTLPAVGAERQDAAGEADDLGSPPTGRQPVPRRTTVTLTLMPGAEPWIRVQHSRGWFKVPAGVAASEILRGVSEGWSAGTRRRTEWAVATIRVPLAEWSLLQAQAAGAAHR